MDALANRSKAAMASWSATPILGDTERGVQGTVAPRASAAAIADLRPSSWKP
jgi:hypothetical protein